MRRNLPTEEVTQWIRSQLNDLREEGPLLSITLVHAIEVEGIETLGRVRISDDDVAEDIGQAVWDIAVSDAETRPAGRMQRYVMWAYRDESGSPDAQKPFLLQGRASLDMLGGDTEGATGSGHLAQLMRHNEKTMQMLAQLTEVTAGRMARDLEAERSARLKLEEEKRKSFELMADLQDRKHERDLEMQRERDKAERHEKLMGTFMAMVPILASRLLQTPAGPQAPAALARDDALHKFLENLSQDEIQGILNALSMENQVTIMELYSSHKQLSEQTAEKEADAE